MDTRRIISHTAWVIALVTLCGGSAGAQLWSYGLAYGVGHASLSDNFGRIPADDVKIPTLYDAASGHAWFLNVGRRIGARTRLGVDLSAWSRHGRGPVVPDQILGAVTLTWSTHPGLELTGGIGMGLARITYLEQGIESTMIDHGMGVLGALGGRYHLWRGVSFTPRLQWFGFAGKDVQVWAKSSVVLVGFTWSPKETS